MRRTFAAAFGALALTFAGIASAQADQVDPPTIEADTDVCGSITLTFINPTPWFYAFDYKVDAEASVSSDEFGELWNLVEVDGTAGEHEATETITFEEDSGDHVVEYRVARGAESDLYDWDTWWSSTVTSDCADDGGTDGGAEDGSEGGAEDGSEGGAEDGSEGGAEDGSEGGAEDGAEGGADDGAEGGAEDGSEGGADDGAEGGADDGAEGGADDGAEGGAEVGTDGGAEDGADDGSSACDAYVGSSEWCDDGVPDYNCTDSNPDVPAVPAEHQPVDLVDSDDDPFGLDADNDGVGCENGGGSANGAEDGDDGGTGGAEDGSDDGADGADDGTDELPDTGMGSTLLTLAGVTLFAGGALLIARRRMAL